MKYVKGYAAIILAVVAISYLGGIFTMIGIDSGWYSTLNLPDWTPNSQIIGTAWAIIYVLTALAAIISYRVLPIDKWHNVSIWFMLNGILNVMWSYMFFVLHNIDLSIIGAGFLGLTVLIIALKIRHTSILLRNNQLRLAAVMLYPYLGWTILATILTANIASINY